MSEMKQCGFCGKEFVRGRYACGVMEPPKTFAKRKFCSKQCAGADFDRRHGTYAAPSSGWYHARKSVAHSDCAVCHGRPGHDVHHIDGDNRNNNLSNLIRLCRSCHMKVHKGGLSIVTTKQAERMAA